MLHFGETSVSAKVLLQSSLSGREPAGTVGKMSGKEAKLGPNGLMRCRLIRMQTKVIRSIAGRSAEAQVAVQVVALQYTVRVTRRPANILQSPRQSRSVV